MEKKLKVHTPDALKRLMDQHIVGHDDPKIVLSNLAYQQICKAYAATKGYELKMDSANCLIIGATGSGKSLCVKTLAGVIHPLASLIESATAFTGNGYVGASIEDIPKRILAAVNGDRFAARFGMVALDEICKIKSHARVDLDVSGELVQSGLLRILEGGKITDHRSEVTLDMDKVMFVGAGTFIRQDEDSLHDIVLERLGDVPEGPGSQRYRLLKEAKHEDLIKFGFTPEFANRFQHLVVLDEPDLSAHIQIAKLPNGPIKSYRDFFGIHGIELIFDDEALELIARRSYEAGRGVRGMGEIGHVLTPIIYRLPDYVSMNASKLIVTVETVKGEAGPRVEKTGKKKDRLICYGKESEYVQAFSTRPAIADGYIFTDTSGMSDSAVRTKLQEVRDRIDWANTTGSARKWWEAFEQENQHRISLVLRLAEELDARKATITEFFLSYVYSNTDNIQANLHYLDYTRLKKSEDQKNRELRERRERESSDNNRSMFKYDGEEEDDEVEDEEFEEDEDDDEEVLRQYEELTADEGDETDDCVD